MAATDDSPRPAHLRPRFLAIVGLGGALGTALRAGATLLFPASDGALPGTVLAINLIGAFTLGLLLERLARSAPGTPGPEEGWRLDLRLGIGTGLIGGFTTYSAFAGDTVLLLGSGSVLWASAYALGTVLLGAVATWLGLVAASAGSRPDQRREEPA